MKKTIILARSASELKEKVEFFQILLKDQIKILATSRNEAFIKTDNMIIELYINKGTISVRGRRADFLFVDDYFIYNDEFEYFAQTVTKNSKNEAEQ